MTVHEQAPTQVQTPAREPVSSPSQAQHSLLATARPAHPSEPILIPKLRIGFADFPYLHYSKN